MNQEMVVKFYGPIPWIGEGSINSHPRGKESGIYLWTAETRKGFEIFYVGETITSFIYRLGQHLNNQLAGKYHFYVAEALRERRKETPWKGIVGMKGAKIETYHKNFEVWNPLNIGFIKSVKFFIAPLPVHDPQIIHKRLLHRVEGGLIEYLWKQEGNFLDKTVHSRRLKESETPIQTRFEGPERLIGFPAIVEV